MESKRERARDIAEEGLDMIVEGEEEEGQKLIEQAKKIDPKAVEELAEEIEQRQGERRALCRKEIAARPKSRMDRAEASQFGRPLPAIADRQAGGAPCDRARNWRAQLGSSLLRRV